MSAKKKPAAPRALSLSAIVRRRNAENALLRRDLERVRSQMAALKTEEALLLMLLREDDERPPPAAATAESDLVKCADCGVNAHRSQIKNDECPACTASPFEAA
jgi:hypothetical protein